MDRLSTINPADATGAAAKLFANIKKAVGKVPNVYAVVGAHSPDVLASVLAAEDAIGKSSLSKSDVEAVNLTVSEIAGCNYCVAAHTFIGKLVGLSQEATKQVRAGTATGDAKRDALVRFVRKLISTHGTLPATDLDALRAAGYSDQQVIEIALVISSVTFTNLVNRANDTVVDFPAVD